jgi:DNA modification methylase
MCGDSTKKEDVEKLMDGKKADMVFTDPPYGIDIVSKNGSVGGENLCKVGVYSEVIGDKTTDCAEEFYNLCNDIGCKKQIIWGGNYFVKFLPFSDS